MFSIYLAVTITFAGGGNVGGLISGNTDGTGVVATFSSPKGVALDTLGVVFIADFGNNLIRKISATGTNCFLLIIII